LVIIIVVERFKQDSLLTWSKMLFCCKFQSHAPHKSENCGRYWKRGSTLLSGDEAVQKWLFKADRKY